MQKSQRAASDSSCMRDSISGAQDYFWRLKEGFAELEQGRPNRAEGGTWLACMAPENWFPFSPASVLVHAGKPA